MPQTPAPLISNIPQGLRTRFAPSPTGYLHLGHVASAIYLWGLAAKSSAQIILRIEDHDEGRSRKAFETSILEDLHWLGFHADQGVTSADQRSDFRQSDHKERYEEALLALGDQVYRCACSRKDIVERTGQNRDELWYDGFCREKNTGPNIRLRLDQDPEFFNDLYLGAQSQTPAEQCGDLLLRDRDGCWTYNFAVTVDDLAEDMGLIVRGQDILPSTGRQLKLRRLLQSHLSSFRVPLYAHHPLIWADENHKLSKRDRSTSIDQWRSQGFSAPQLIGKAAFQVGLIDREREIVARDVGELFL